MPELRELCCFALPLGTAMESSAVGPHWRVGFWFVGEGVFVCQDFAGVTSLIGQRTPFQLCGV